MPTDADFMYSQLQVPFAINPFPIVTGHAYINASQTLISEWGNILLDGKIVNSNTINIPQFNFDSSELNLSATSVNINGSLTNSKVSTMYQVYGLMVVILIWVVHYYHQIVVWLFQD